MKLKYLILLLLLVLLCKAGIALEIKGNIQMDDEWKPVVFLASLNSPENLFVASPDFVISEAFIQPDGNFSINTSDIPSELRYYRLYMVKGDLNSVEFNSVKNKNYMHLLLNRGSSVELKAIVNDNIFQLLEFKGSPENKAILSFDKEFEKRNSQITVDLSKAKSDFLVKGLEDYIRHFVDTTANCLVGLYALYHLDDKETDFLRNSDFYFDFQNRIQSEHATGIYTQAFSDLLKDLVGFRDLVCEIPGVAPRWKDWVIFVESVLLLLLLIGIVLLALKLKAYRSKSEESGFSKLAFQNLTEKEKEILKLLAQGNTNKEIALKMFVELSTVKTHINSIYRQLKLSNRKEAIQFFNSL